MLARMYVPRSGPIMAASGSDHMPSESLTCELVPLEVTL
jgi:hypothetical protein